MSEFVLAVFIMSVGLSVAGMLTHLYQGLAGQPAALRHDGASVLGMLGNLTLSFLCGPYIMLQMGWRQEEDGTVSRTSALLSAFIAFGWSFLTGLLLLGAWLAVTGR